MKAVRVEPFRKNKDAYMVNNIDRKNHSRDIAITLLHVIGMAMIFLCHSMQAEKIYFLSEIFISGVPLFLFVSGYLAGKKEIENVWRFWLGKVQRVLVPLFVLIIVIYGGYVISGLAEVSPFQWIFTLFNLQGLNYTYWKFGYFGAVAGCGHWWFLTTLMFCYILTPLMQKFKRITVTGWKKLILVIGILLIQLGLLFLGFQLSYIITFFFGYFIAGKPVRTDIKWYSFVTALMVGTVALRLVARVYIDGSDIYDRYIALVSAAFIAVWIFYTVYFLKERLSGLFDILDCKAVHFTDRISYYFYLTHYLFLSGPLSMFNFIDNRPLAHLAAFALSYLSATVMFFAVEKGLFRVLKWSKV